MLRFSVLFSFLLYVAVITPTVVAAPNELGQPKNEKSTDLVEATTKTEADLSDYALPDERLSLSLVDSSPDDSYLAVKCDSQNQLFVGGRRKLFVLKPNDDGTWKPRELVYEFPEHTWVYDIEFRGDDVFVSTVSAIYRLPGARTSTKDIKPVRLLYGIPRGHTHQCFHALAWGPNGKLFFTFGDPSWYLLAIRLGTTATSRAPITGPTGRLFMAQKKNSKSTTVLVQRCPSIRTVRNSKATRADFETAVVCVLIPTGICSPTTTTTNSSLRSIHRDGCYILSSMLTSRGLTVGCDQRRPAEWI